MPELPEVETVVKGISAKLLGQKIKSVTFSNKKLRRERTKEFAQHSVGATVSTVWRRAKYIVIDLNNGYSILIHLGMSGKLLLKNQPCNEKHTHMNMQLPHCYLIFNDPRRFGLIDIYKTNKLPFDDLGVEPFSKSFTANYLERIFIKRKLPIKLAIMDQKIVVGVGNIYASEALFDCKLHPQKPANQVIKDELAKLVHSIQKILKQAIKSGGSTLKDYSQSDGTSGYFQHEFQVYGQAGKPCPKCHRPILNIRLGGRSTFYCASCQKI